jgi:hypothetical protein
MNYILKTIMRIRFPALLVLVSAIALSGLSPSMAQQADKDAKFVPLQTSINAVMVDLVDHSAHFIWDASYAPKLSGRDWQVVEQHAIQLVASGTLISLPGTGVADRGWVVSPAWQEWAQKLADGGLAALAAVKTADQRALERAGDVIVETCEGCHSVFKPDTPTEGILHVPHYDE